MPFILNISSDQVYSGNGFQNEASASPINSYGRTKLLGEHEISALGGISPPDKFFGKSLAQNRKSFTDWIISEVRNKGTINGFKDIFFNPLHLSTLCELIALLIRQKPVGIYNAGSVDGISKADFIEAFLDSVGQKHAIVKKVDSHGYKAKAQRPYDMRMNSNKLSRKIGWHSPLIHQEISKAAEDYKL